MAHSLITKVNNGHELYVYYNNELIYKRWLNHGYSKTFHDGEGETQFCSEIKQEKSNINNFNNNKNNKNGNFFKKPSRSSK